MFYKKISFYKFCFFPIRFSKSSLSAISHINVINNSPHIRQFCPSFLLSKARVNMGNGDGESTLAAVRQDIGVCFFVDPA
jgi:hypothetical protein